MRGARPDEDLLVFGHGARSFELGVKIVGARAHDRSDPDDATGARQPDGGPAAPDWNPGNSRWAPAAQHGGEDCEEGEQNPGDLEAEVDDVVDQDREQAGDQSSLDLVTARVAEEIPGYQPEADKDETAQEPAAIDEEL